MKECTKCHENKPETEYHASASKFGLQSWCKACQHAQYQPSANGPKRSGFLDFPAETQAAIKADRVNGLTLKAIAEKYNAKLHNVKTWSRTNLI